MTPEPGVVEWDVFISHASEDKAQIALPLAKRLEADGLRVWLDKHEIRLGDSIRQKIDLGLRNSRYGVVILSPRFFAKKWTQKELDALTALVDVTDKKILPVWHEVTAEDVARNLPLFAGMLAVSTADGIDSVAAAIVDVARRRDAAARTYTIEDLFSRDPSTSLPAAAALAPDLSSLGRVIATARALNPVQVIAVREYLARAPEAAAPLVTGAILRAQDDWHAASSLPQCLSAAHRLFSESALAEAASKSELPDVARLATEALGYLGASGWRWALVERLEKLDESNWSGDMYDKLEYYVVLAVLRMFQNARQTGDWERGYRDELKSILISVETVLALGAKHKWRSTLLWEVRYVVSTLPADRGDLLLEQWLSNEKDYLRALAARALGNIGYRRFAPHLAATLAADDEHDVRHAAALALGNIGGSEAVEALLTHSFTGDPISESAELGLSAALRTCAADEIEDIGGRLLETNVSEKCWVYRAMGLSKDVRFLGTVRRGLSSADLTVRAMSALAIARIGGKKELDVVRKAALEATSAMEKVLTHLAVIVASSHKPEPALLASLRDALAVESYAYKSYTTDDIVAELEACATPDAQHLADSWKRVYATRMSY